jgi:hypothetical protein
MEDARMMTESELQDKVLDLCRERGLLAFHAFDSRKTAGKGFPDLVISGLKRTVFAELKTDYGKLDHVQVMWKYALIASGQSWYLWRPRDLYSLTIESTLNTL